MIEDYMARQNQQHGQTAAAPGLSEFKQFADEMSCIVRHELQKETRQLRGAIAKLYANLAGPIGTGARLTFNNTPWWELIDRNQPL